MCYCFNLIHTHTHDLLSVGEGRPIWHVVLSDVCVTSAGCNMKLIYLTILLLSCSDIKDAVSDISIKIF
jgi:hypothetical protein